MSVDMLRQFQVFQILSKATGTSLFVDTNRVCKGGGGQGRPGRVTLRAKHQNRQDGQHHKQSDSQPKRKENPQEQALHEVLLTRCSDLTGNADLRNALGLLAGPGKNVAYTANRFDVLVALGVAQL